MTARRYVVDSNVLISAAISPEGTARRALSAILSEGRLLFSDATFVELASRLLRPKFDKWVSPSSRHEFLERLAEAADWIEIEGQRMGCRDATDDKFLETALVGNADAIISGDADLLVMHPFENIPILAPGNWPD